MKRKQIIYKRSRLVISNKKKRHPLYAPIDWKKATQIFEQPTIHATAPMLTETIRRIPVKEILRIVAAVGTIGIIFACPPAGAALGTLLLDGKPYHRWKVRSTIDQLKRQKYVSVTYNQDGSMTVTITKRGMTRALTYQLDTMKLHRPKIWDKKWRVVIFDVPNRYEGTRDIFRKRLGQLGLKKLQKSVFISPYPCFKEIEFLRELYGIAIKVRYLLVEQIEDDVFLKRQFNL